METGHRRHIARYDNATEALRSASAVHLNTKTSNRAKTGTKLTWRMDGRGLLAVGVEGKVVVEHLEGARDWAALQEK